MGKTGQTFLLKGNFILFCVFFFLYIFDIFFSFCILIPVFFYKIVFTSIYTLYKTKLCSGPASPVQF